MDDDIAGGIARLWVYLFVGGLLVGLLFIGWAYLLGPLSNRVDYNNFNSSPQHIQAVAQKFADDCEQLAQTSDPVVRKAIEQDIYQVASTVDLSQVQMPDGTRACVNHAITDVTKGK